MAQLPDDRARREVMALVEVARMDPRAWPDVRDPNADRAPAAELIRGGMVKVDAEGFLTVTGRHDRPAKSSAYGPEHPVPVALLDALNRQGVSSSAVRVATVWRPSFRRSDQRGRKQLHRRSWAAARPCVFSNVMERQRRVGECQPPSLTEPTTGRAVKA